MFPTSTFLERVYKDGIRILIYKAVNDVPRLITYNLFPYDAIFEEGSYVKFRFHTTWKPSNYVLYYDDKYINDERYVSRRNETIRNNSSMVKCLAYDFKIDDIKIDLIKANGFTVKDLSKETLDDLWVGVYFDREENKIRYDLCRKTYTNHILKADKSITTSIIETRYMDSKLANKFAVKLEYMDAIEISKYKTDSRKYIELMKYINEIRLNPNTDWLCDNKSKLSTLVKHGLDTEFVYRACMVDNMVFMIEDVYRNIRNGSIYGPIYKTYLD
jgi:hypothetical protein